MHPYSESGYEERAGLQTLNPFLAIPSLRELSATSIIAVRDGHTGKPFDWRYADIHSNLEKVELAYCCTSGSELAKVLSHTPRLRSFKLAYQTKWHGCGHDWDVNEVIAMLGQHCGNSLNELSVTIDTQHGTLKGGVTSLKRFTHLERLELDVRFFFRPPVTEQLREMRPEDYRSHAYSIGWNASAIPSLADVLPPGIRGLRLLTGVEREDPVVIKSLSANINARRAEYLPLLGNGMVHRAIPRVGHVSVLRDHDPAAWASVRETVILAGFGYEESAETQAVWLDDYGRRYP